MATDQEKGFDEQSEMKDASRGTVHEAAGHGHAATDA